VQRTHGVRIRECCRGEWAGTEHYFDTVATRPDDGIKALARHRVDHNSYRIVYMSWPESSRTDRPSANLDCRVSGSDHLGEEQAESLIRSGDAPAAFGCGMQGVVEAWASTARAGSVVLRDEIGAHQLRQVLADCIVVEAEMRREFGDVDRPARIGDVPKDLMASWVAERSRLFLQ
jgi:hypothetical protein